MSATEWKIDKAQKACQQCARQFGPGEGFFSALYLEAEQFQRRNFCPACFAAAAESYSFWKTRAPEEHGRKKEDRAALMCFFERLMDSPREGTEARVAFVLALMLLRKRMLRLKHRQAREGGETLLLERTSDSRTFALDDPNLTEADIARTSEDMGKLFEVEITL